MVHIYNISQSVRKGWKKKQVNTGWNGHVETFPFFFFFFFDNIHISQKYKLLFLNASIYDIFFLWFLFVSCVKRWHRPLCRCDISRHMYNIFRSKRKLHWDVINMYCYTCWRSPQLISFSPEFIVVVLVSFAKLSQNPLLWGFFNDGCELHTVRKSQIVS